MESGLYGALRGVEAIAPPKGNLLEVHDAYVTMASTARCTDQQRGVFLKAGRALVDVQGADAVLLAGTDLALAFDGRSPDFPVVDCAQAHIEVITAAVLGS